MAVAPTPQEIYERADAEGHRRLFMPLLEQVATSFIAGVTIVFGIAALGVVEALVEPDLGTGVAKVAGALAFGVGVVFLVVGRTELFSENFFHPVATAIEGNRLWGRLARLWLTTLVLNLIGGAVLAAVLTVEGALPGDSAQALASVAEEIAAKGWPATLACGPGRRLDHGAVVHALGREQRDGPHPGRLHGGRRARPGSVRPRRGVRPIHPASG